MEIFARGREESPAYLLVGKRMEGDALLLHIWGGMVRV